MTANDIISLVFEYETELLGQSPARHMAARIDLTAAIHGMMKERDEALEHCESARFGEILVMRERDEARAGWAECALLLAQCEKDKIHLLATMARVREFLTEDKL